MRDQELVTKEPEAQGEETTCGQLGEPGSERDLGIGFWRWMAFVTVLVVVLVVALRFVFSAGMRYAGYCFAEQKTLSDNEKIRAVVRNVLKKYPPAVIRTPVDYGWSVSPPDEPIHYKDVDEFLALNPGCCELTQIRNPEEGIGFTFMERVKGTASSFARIDYQVRYREDGAVKSVLSKNHFAISNCGEPQEEPFRRF